MSTNHTAPAPTTHAPLWALLIPADSNRLPSIVQLAPDNPEKPQDVHTHLRSMYAALGCRTVERIGLDVPNFEGRFVAELWCDEEGLFHRDATRNARASQLACADIVRDVLLVVSDNDTGAFAPVALPDVAALLPVLIECPPANLDPEAIAKALEDGARNFNTVRVLASAMKAEKDARRALQSARAKYPKRTDASALDAIADLLDGNEWDAGTASDIADLVRATGRDVGHVDGDAGTTAPDLSKHAHGCGVFRTGMDCCTCDADEDDEAPCEKCQSKEHGADACPHDDDAPEDASLDIERPDGTTPREAPANGPAWACAECGSTETVHNDETEEDNCPRCKTSVLLVAVPVDGRPACGASACVQGWIEDGRNVCVCPQPEGSAPIIAPAVQS